MRWCRKALGVERIFMQNLNNYAAPVWALSTENANGADYRFQPAQVLLHLYSRGAKDDRPGAPCCSSLSLTGGETWLCIR